MPEPLIPFANYNEWAKQSSILKDLENKNETQKIKEIFIDLISSLPPENKPILERLVLFCKKVTTFSNINKMTSTNVNFLKNKKYLKNKKIK